MSQLPLVSNNNYTNVEGNPDETLRARHQNQIFVKVWAGIVEDKYVYILADKFK